jgi:Protein of unknown function (DUF2939)
MRWAIGIVVAVICGGALYLTSAVVSVDALVRAAKAGNGAEVIARTNAERLRRSLVDQIVAAYLERTGQKKPLERLLANTYGASIADAMLQKMLTAENLTKLLQTGVISGPDISTSVVPNVLSIDTSSLLEFLGRIRPVKITEIAIRTSKSADPETYSAVSIHFEGTGWKLSGINLPRNVTRRLASALPVK